MSPSEVHRIAQILTRIAQASSDPIEIANRAHFDPDFKALDEAVQNNLLALFGLELDDLDNSGSVQLRPGWGHQLLLDGFTLRDAPNDAVELWVSLIPEVSAPAFVALIRDALLSGRHDASATNAVATIDAYIDAASQESADPLYAAYALARANTIVRSRGMSADELHVRANLLSLANRFLPASVTSGVLARLIIPLSVPARSGPVPNERVAVLRLLDQTEFAHPDATTGDWIADCRRRLADTPAERLLATERQVSAYLNTARSEESGFGKMHWADAAAKIARQHQALAAHDAAVRYMQSIPRDSMGWQSHTFDATLPKSALRAHVRRYKHALDWRDALQIFLLSGSPSGDYKHNLETSASTSSGSIRSLFSTTHVGVHGMPERHSSDFANDELVRVEQFTLLTHGILLDLELKEMAKRFGAPDPDFITGWLCSRYGCDREIAGPFVSALIAFQEARFTASALLSIPLIEAGARGLLLRLDEALYRIETGENPGRFPALDFYVDKLEGLGLDIDWVRALRTTLLSPGMNLRNLAAHGFRFSFAPSESALLLRLAGLFCAMPVAIERVTLPASPIRFRTRIRSHRVGRRTRS